MNRLARTTITTWGPAMLRHVASNPALRGSLHRASSNPALRSAAQRAVAAVSVAPPLPSRTFVSAVLLTRDAYDAKKVSELKDELKHRGLSTAGKRTDLVRRLVDNDGDQTQVIGSGAPISVSSSKPLVQQPRTTSKTGKSRSASTQAVRSSKSSPSLQQQSAKQSQSSSSPQGLPEESAGVVGTKSGGATIPHPTNMEPGQVSANFIDPALGGAVQPETLEPHSTAPGVPPEKVPQAPITFEVKIPYEPEPIDAGPEIPVMTAYFHPETTHYSGHRSPQDGPVAHMPKVRTVSGEETYLGGGVSHHQPIFDDAHLTAEEPAEDKASGESSSLSSAVNSLFSEMQKDLGWKTESRSSGGKRSITLDTTRSLLKDARESFRNAAARTAGSGSGSASYSTASSSYSGGNERPLNDEERRGLYVLGGIVLGGYLLGGAGKQSKRRMKKVQENIDQQVEDVRKQTSLIDDVELAGLVARAESALRTQQ